jgi:hypothetical protein
MQNPSAYEPDPAAVPVLGDIVRLVRQARAVNQVFTLPPKLLAVLPTGQLFLDSELQLDTDGAPELSGDPTQQSDTSLHTHDRRPINANRVPYFVLPGPKEWPRQFGIGLGDLAAVIFGDRLAFAVFADSGPPSKIGEGSIELFRRLGQERVRPNGTVRDIGMGPGVITIVFPGSSMPADLENESVLLAAIAARGPGLFQNLGGMIPTE